MNLAAGSFSLSAGVRLYFLFGRGQARVRRPGGAVRSKTLLAVFDCIDARWVQTFDLGVSRLLFHPPVTKDQNRPPR